MSPPGELGLFQLKWQDFSTNDVARQRSKAKNFTEKVDAWARDVQGWLAEFGTESLLRSFRMKAVRPISQIYVFAVGRSAARFQSYGFAAQVRTLASATWRQFTRLRFEIGPSEHVLGDLHAAIQAERMTPLKLIPIRQEMSLGRHTIVLENLWNAFDHDDGSSLSDEYDVKG